MASRGSSLSRWLEPLTASLWTLFVLCSVLVTIVWSLGVGDAALEHWVPHGELRAALTWLLHRLDLFWITLAAINGYLVIAAREGLPVARSWGWVLFAVVIAIGWISALTGFPLGPITYGESLGVKLGPVPVGLPLFWFAVFLGARDAVVWIWPSLGPSALALAVGALAATTAFNLDPLAARLRGFWFWRPAVPSDPPVFDPPFYGCLVWGITLGILAFVLRERTVVTSARPRSRTLAGTLLIFNAVFLAAHLGKAFRG